MAGLARRVEKVEEVAKKLEGEKGKLYAFKCDLTKEEEIVSAIKNIISKLGSVYVLVNNAGLSVYGSLLNGNAKDWKTILGNKHYVLIFSLHLSTIKIYRYQRAWIVYSNSGSYTEYERNKGGRAHCAHKQHFGSHRSGFSRP